MLKICFIQITTAGTQLPDLWLLGQRDDAVTWVRKEQIPYF